MLSTFSQDTTDQQQPLQIFGAQGASCLCVSALILLLLCCCFCCVLLLPQLLQLQRRRLLLLLSLLLLLLAVMRWLTAAESGCCFRLSCFFSIAV